eukprot:scaffold455167_cov18-Prasinocladus_malaysianus.AAC.1
MLQACPQRPGPAGAVRERPLLTVQPRLRDVPPGALSLRSPRARPLPAIPGQGKKNSVKDKYHHHYYSNAHMMRTTINLH